MAMILFVLIFMYSNRPTFQCQFSNEVSSYLPTIYGITPTYARLAQKADLTRLSQTLMLVKNFHWIVVEDSEKKTKLVENLLKESNLTYTHLNVKTHKPKQSTASGVEQRNSALEWLRKHLLKIEDKKDEENKQGRVPVGIVGGMRVEMPIVTDGKITGFNAVWKPFRPFPVDMAGFAINSTLFVEHAEAKFSRNVQSGFQ
ncbi:Galactosylgalactosylxylosylprotein 3-beta-glucuronosyltransferase I, partial [Eumeta japonica]